MESLVANYASSDEEQELHHPKPPPSLSTTSFFASLPKPKPNSSSSSSLFSSLPKPKPQTSLSSTFTPLREKAEESPNPTSKLFSSLPPPKSEKPQQPIPEAPKPKRVVQIRAPINPFARKSSQIDEDDDDEEEEKERKKRNESENLAQAPSVKSFLSSIPAPRYSTSLGALPSSGSGRRAIIEADVPASSSGGVENHQPPAVVDQSVENYGNYDGNYAAYADYEQGIDQNAGNYVNYAESYGTYESGVVDQSSAGVDYGHYPNNWIDRSGGDMAPELAAVSERELRVSGKRRRNDVPTEIVEVKQDELMKNRPREDTAKLTGIAFGPSYQPASSSKGKPSKLHKRKHQIGTLYFDMKQKEMELSERRAKGFLTKAETQAKYGW